MWIITIIGTLIIVSFGIAVIYGSDRWRSETEARYRDKLSAMPWVGRFGEYLTRNGMLIPLYGEVGWEYPEGIRLYFKGMITEINYEFAV
jgi:hypothetical protein